LLNAYTDSVIAMYNTDDITITAKILTSIFKSKARHVIFTTIAR